VRWSRRPPGSDRNCGVPRQQQRRHRSAGSAAPRKSPRPSCGCLAPAPASCWAPRWPSTAAISPERCAPDNTSTPRVEETPLTYQNRHDFEVHGSVDQEQRLWSTVNIMLRPLALVAGGLLLVSALAGCSSDEPALARAAPPGQAGGGPLPTAERSGRGSRSPGSRTARDVEKPRAALTIGSSGRGGCRSDASGGVSGLGEGVPSRQLRPGGAEQTGPTWSRSVRRRVLHLAQVGPVCPMVCGRRPTGWPGEGAGRLPSVQQRRERRR
jgi:hypothetical protein